MPQLRTVRVGMQRRFLSESVLHPVEQRPLVGLEFYQEVLSLLSDAVDDVFLRRHGVASEYLPSHVQLADKERHGLYLVALFLTGSRFKGNS